MEVLRPRSFVPVRAHRKAFSATTARLKKYVSLFIGHRAPQNEPFLE